jgi:integrase
LLALTWDDIDFAKNEMIINKTLVKSKEQGKLTLKVQFEPKTKSSNRTIPMLDKYSVKLKEMKLNRLNNKFNDNNIVFCSKVGTHIYPDNMRRSLRKICEKLGIERIGTHSLRHTFTTRLYESNIDDVTRSALLGHAKVAMTHRYTHVSSEMKRTSIKKLENINFINDID